MPTSWSPTNNDFQPYRSREILVRDSKDEPSDTTSKGFIEDSIPTVDKDNVESSGHTPEDSLAVASEINSDSDEPSDTTSKGFIEDSIPTVDKDNVESSGHTPEDSLAVASEINSDSGDGCDSVDPVRKAPKRGTKNSCVSAIVIWALFCVPSVTGPSPQKVCWDLQSNCSRYKDDKFCKPGIDKDINEKVPWLFKNCQRTCICDKLTKENTTDKNQACITFQYDSECLQRPPAEEFRNKCPFTCYYSRTPELEGFLTSPKNKTIKEGMNVSLECSINSTSPRVNFTWFKNDIPVDLGKTVQNNSYTSILIIGAALSDEGEYHCRATNSDYGQVLSVNSSRGILSIEKGPTTILISILVPGGLVFLVVVVVVVVFLGVLKSRKHNENNNEQKEHMGLLQS
ncbi:uncharacterized protein LOC124282458 isoform X2 [Haliotis rubra]|uniref:uncharacterized protein LOC124282458 isoform X2 n=1 Tax=Haliotis rubra TaxID=36100 RepID=UPI001EE620EF|nr:uncharacterized protein LOC124282458 isoform X2 [Haliotis rubra]